MKSDLQNFYRIISDNRNNESHFLHEKVIKIEISQIS